MWLGHECDMLRSCVQCDSLAWMSHGSRMRASCYMLLKHTTATHCCNTLLQHATATQQYEWVMAHKWLRRATHYCNILLKNTTATHFCSTLLQHSYTKESWLMHECVVLHKLMFGKWVMAHKYLRRPIREPWLNRTNKSWLMHECVNECITAHRWGRCATHMNVLCVCVCVCVRVWIPVIQRHPLKVCCSSSSHGNESYHELLSQVLVPTTNQISHKPIVGALSMRRGGKYPCCRYPLWSWAHFCFGLY